jgi:hypothetical protein
MRMFWRVFGILMIVSVLFQVALDWDNLSRAGWPLRVLLAKLPVAAAVAMLATGAVLIFQRRPEDDDQK